MTARDALTKATATASKGAAVGGPHLLRCWTLFDRLVETHNQHGRQDPVQSTVPFRHGSDLMIAYDIARTDGHSVEASSASRPYRPLSRWLGGCTAVLPSAAW
jgi:hypothetical protein